MKIRKNGSRIQERKRTIKHNCLSCLHRVNGICLLKKRIRNPSKRKCNLYTPKTKTYQLTSTIVPVVREQMMKVQNNICPICKKVIKSPALDHHHTKRVKGTGKIRGVICRSCNIFLAKSENNAIRYNVTQEELPNVLRNIANYLEDKQYEYIHPSEKEKPQRLKKSSYNKLQKMHLSQSLIKAKLPNYPKSRTLIKPLVRFFKTYKITPEFYKK